MGCVESSETRDDERYPSEVPSPRTPSLCPPDSPTFNVNNPLAASSRGRDHPVAESGAEYRSPRHGTHASTHTATSPSARQSPRANQSITTATTSHSISTISSSRTQAPAAGTPDSHQNKFILPTAGDTGVAKAQMLRRHLNEIQFEKLEKSANPKPSRKPVVDGFDSPHLFALERATTPEEESCLANQADRCPSVERHSVGLTGGGSTASECTQVYCSAPDEEAVATMKPCPTPSDDGSTGGDSVVIQPTIPRIPTDTQLLHKMNSMPRNQQHSQIRKDFSSYYRQNCSESDGVADTSCFSVVSGMEIVDFTNREYGGKEEEEGGYSADEEEEQVIVVGAAVVDAGCLSSTNTPSPNHHPVCTKAAKGRLNSTSTTTTTYSSTCGTDEYPEGEVLGEEANLFLQASRSFMKANGGLGGVEKALMHAPKDNPLDTLSATVPSSSSPATTQHDLSVISSSPQESSNGITAAMNSRSEPTTPEAQGTAYSFHFQQPQQQSIANNNNNDNNKFETWLDYNDEAPLPIPMFTSNPVSRTTSNVSGVSMSAISRKSSIGYAEAEPVDPSWWQPYFQHPSAAKSASGKSDKSDAVASKDKPEEQLTEDENLLALILNEEEALFCDQNIHDETDRYSAAADSNTTSNKNTLLPTTGNGEGRESICSTKSQPILLGQAERRQGEIIVDVPGWLDEHILALETCCEDEL